ncbi:MAG TPA: hypothetical protein DCW44_05415 [Eubacterium sp.]|nr:hypothetical protein [Eubacterium sp.]
MGNESMKNCEFIPLTELLLEIIDNRGKTCPTVSEGFPLIATNCIKDSSIYPVFENIRYISEETRKNWFRAELKPNDIIFVNKGTPGKVCLVPEPVNFCAAQDMVGLRVDPEKIYYKYLYVVLKSDYIQKKIANFHVGIMIPHFKKSDMEELLIPVPSMSIQKKIGDLYCLLSEKIEVNNKINDNLQKQLELSFDYYFNNPLTSKKWKSGVLSDIATITMGQSPSGDSYNNVGDGTPFYQGSTDFGTIFPMIRMYTTAPSRMAEKLDTLLSVRAPVGTMNVSFEKCCIGRGLAAIQGNNDNNIFVRYLLKRNQWYFDNINNSGTTFGSITKDYLYKMPITIPDDMSIKRFEDNAKTLEYQIYNREKEIRTLSSIRNWLLPMLMNGQAIIVE